MNTEQRHEEIEIDCMLAEYEIREQAKKAIERSNRALGQHMRYTMAKFELLKREYGVEN